MEVTIFKPKIQAILKSSDLETVSAKKVRKQLQADIGLDLTAHKKELDELIKACFLQFTEAPEEVKPEIDVLGDRISTPKVRVKKEEHVEERNVKAETSSEEGRVDADVKYARELQAQYDSPRASRSSRSDRGKNGTTPKRKRVVKRKTETIVNTDGETVEVEVKRKVAKNGFNKLLTLSHELATLLGVPYLSRPQVSKQIWAYIKSPENNLQDQEDKRYINCDDKLQSLLGTARVHMFTMTKLLQKHMIDDGTAPEGYGDGQDMKNEKTEPNLSDSDDYIKKMKKEESSEDES